jgi:tetratricopeptide (TPR) repeat protein
MSLTPLTPFSNLAGFDISLGTSLRDIETTYQRQIASNAAQFQYFSTQSLRLQGQAAAANLIAAGMMLRAQEKTNRLLESVRRGINELNAGLDELNATSRATLAAVDAQTDVLRDGLATISGHLAAQGLTLASIDQSLRSPYAREAGELRDEATKWLRVGMGRVGNEQREDFQDALRLFGEVVVNPIGNQDCVVWFHIGWLRWKHLNDFGEAEAAFRRAARLSSANGGPYHLLSVRHLAHMQYLQGRREEAYQTIVPVIEKSLDHDTPFDAARYAAITGRLRESLGLLEATIRRMPMVITTMFADADFKEIIPDLLELRHRIVGEARVDTIRVTELLCHAMGQVQEVSAQTGCKIGFPIGAEKWLKATKETTRVKEYIQLLNTQRQAGNFQKRVLEIAFSTLRSAAAQKRMDINAAQQQRDAWEAQHKALLTEWESERVRLKHQVQHVTACIGTFLYAYIIFFCLGYSYYDHGLQWFGLILFFGLVYTLFLLAIWVVPIIRLTLASKKHEASLALKQVRLSPKF